MQTLSSIRTLRTVAPNHRGTDFFVGDLHGCRTELERVMRERGVDPDRGDRVFCVGDLVDRGPESMQCLSLLREDWFFAVLGNHEQFMIEAIGDGDPSAIINWTRNGGKWSFEQSDQALRQALDLVISHMSVALEVPCIVADRQHRFGVIHSDVTSEQWGDFFPPEDLWDRHRVKLDIQRPIVGIDQVVVGHTIHPDPARYGNLVNIDTGAFAPKGRMTLLSAEEILHIG